MEKQKNWIEIYQNEAGVVYQCNRERCYWIKFQNKLNSFKVNCFFQLKKLVDEIDIAQMAINPDPAFDYAIISPCTCENCYVLTLSEVLAFQDLLNGTKVMLELNSILNERLYSILV